MIFPVESYIDDNCSTLDSFNRGVAYWPADVCLKIRNNWFQRLGCGGGQLEITYYPDDACTNYTQVQRFKYDQCDSGSLLFSGIKRVTCQKMPSCKDIVLADIAAKRNVTSYRTCTPRATTSVAFLRAPSVISFLAAIFVAALLSK